MLFIITVSTYALKFLLHIGCARGVLRIQSTKRLLICSPHRDGAHLQLSEI